MKFEIKRDPVPRGLTVSFAREWFSRNTDSSFVFFLILILVLGGFRSKGAKALWILDPTKLMSQKT